MTISIDLKKNRRSHQALIQEYKGLLFEYLVGYYLTRDDHKLAHRFLVMMDRDFRRMFRIQEQFVCEHDEHLLEFIKDAAKKMSIFMKEFLSQDLRDIEYVTLAGKRQDSKTSHEGDLIIKKTSEPDERYFSLKFLYQNRLANTKSAGLKSFLAKYFYQFEDIKIIQEEFNLSFQELFQDFVFQHHQSEKYIQQDNYRLIDMNEKDKEKYDHFLMNITDLIYHICSRLKIADPRLFLDSLWPLCGFSNNQVSQFTCVYKKPYEVVELKFDSKKKLENKIIQNMKENFIQLQKDQNKIFIQTSAFVLELRPKAMNHPLRGGMKLNCSFRSNSSGL